MNSKMPSQRSQGPCKSCREKQPRETQDNMLSLDSLACLRKRGVYDNNHQAQEGHKMTIKIASTLNATVTKAPRNVASVNGHQ
jgi:hypothetical protein